MDATKQRLGIGRALVIALRDRLAESGTPNVALSYSPDTAASDLYRELGFVETGEFAEHEVVARWTP